MDEQRTRHLEHLLAFLKTIARPDKSVEQVELEDSLVASGLIDSLAIIQIVVYLETTYGMDFSADGVDPERIASLSSILDLIESRKQ